MTHLIKLELKKFGIAQNIIFMFAGEYPKVCVNLQTDVR